MKYQGLFEIFSYARKYNQNVFHFGYFTKANHLHFFKILRKAHNLDSMDSLNTVHNLLIRTACICGVPNNFTKQNLSNINNC